MYLSISALTIRYAASRFSAGGIKSKIFTMFPAFLRSFQYEPFSHDKFEYNICTSINHPYNQLIQTLWRFDLLLCHSTRSSRTPLASYYPLQLPRIFTINDERIRRCQSNKLLLPDWINNVGS